MNADAGQHEQAWQERIVREVLRRLQSPADAPQHEYALPDQVITLATLDRVPANIRQLVVPERAILTPAVKDALRERGLKVRKADGEPRTAPRGGEPHQRTLFLIGDARRHAAGLAAACDTQEMADINEALGSIHERLASQRPVACATVEPAVLLCRANRDARVRAAWGISLESLSEAERTLRPNVLIVDPRVGAAGLAASLVDAFFNGVERRPR